MSIIWLMADMDIHISVANDQSHDSKFDKIAAKVNHHQKVKSAKSRKIFDFGKKCFFLTNQKLTNSHKKPNPESWSVKNKLLMNRLFQLLFTFNSFICLSFSSFWIFASRSNSAFCSFAVRSAVFFKSSNALVEF